MRHLFSLTLILVALTAAPGPLATHAQETEFEATESQATETGDGVRILTRQVVIEHAAGLNDSVIRLVTDTVSKRMRERQGGDSSAPRFWNAGLGVNRINQPLSAQKILDGLEVWPLYVTYEAGKNLDAPELWEKARGEIEKALRIVQKRLYDARVQDFTREIDDAQHRCDDAERRLSEYTAQLAQNYSGADDDVDFLRQELRTLSSQARELDIDQVGNQARREAIEKRIDELRIAGKEFTSDDPIVEELKKALELRQKIFKRHQTLVDAGLVGGGETPVGDAETALADVRVQLLRAEREASDREFGSVLQELNNELSSLIIEAAELAETRQAIAKEVAQLVDKSNPQNVADMQMLKTRLSLAQNQLAEAEQRRISLDRRKPAELEQITIRLIEEAMFGEAAEPAANQEPVKENE